MSRLSFLQLAQMAGRAMPGLADPTAMSQPGVAPGMQPAFGVPAAQTALQDVQGVRDLVQANAALFQPETGAGVTPAGIGNLFMPQGLSPPWGEPARPKAPEGPVSSQGAGPVSHFSTGRPGNSDEDILDGFEIELRENRFGGWLRRYGQQLDTGAYYAARQAGALTPETREAFSRALEHRRTVLGLPSHLPKAPVAGPAPAGPPAAQAAPAQPAPRQTEPTQPGQPGPEPSPHEQARQGMAARPAPRREGEPEEEFIREARRQTAEALGREATLTPQVQETVLEEYGAARNPELARTMTRRWQAARQLALQGRWNEIPVDLRDQAKREFGHLTPEQKAEADRLKAAESHVRNVHQYMQKHGVDYETADAVVRKWREMGGVMHVASPETGITEEYAAVPERRGAADWQRHSESLRRMAVGGAEKARTTLAEMERDLTAKEAELARLNGEVRAWSGERRHYKPGDVTFVPERGMKESDYTPETYQYMKPTGAEGRVTKNLQEAIDRRAFLEPEVEELRRRVEQARADLQKAEPAIGEHEQAREEIRELSAWLRQRGFPVDEAIGTREDPLKFLRYLKQEVEKRQGKRKEQPAGARSEAGPRAPVMA